MTPAAAFRAHPSRRSVNRWLQVVAGVVGMMAIAGLLFAWPLLRSGQGRSLAESLAATENAFALFIIVETTLAPVEAWLGERFPRWLLVGLGLGLVVFGAFAGTRAQGLGALVASSALGGVGAGLAYGGTVAKTLKRFTDRKALCVGVTAAACAGVLLLALGALAALSSANAGAIPVLIVLGGAQAAVVLVATLLILYPSPETPPAEW